MRGYEDEKALIAGCMAPFSEEDWVHCVEGQVSDQVEWNSKESEEVDQQEEEYQV